MNLDVTGAVFEWRGPAPHHFVLVPDEQAAAIEHAAPSVTYGWGMIPVTCTMSRTTWKTSLWPKDGLYVIPLKVAVRRKEQVEIGDVVTVRLVLDAV